MLHLYADDNLDFRLAGTHYASHAGGLDRLFVDGRIVLDLDAQAGDAVVQFLDVFPAAEALKNLGRYAGIVAGVQRRALVYRFILFIRRRFTAGRLQVELEDEEAEQEEINQKEGDANRQNHPGIFGHGRLGAQNQVDHSGAEVEARADWQDRQNRHGDGRQDRMHKVQPGREEHERKFNRLRHAGDEGSDGRREQKARGALFVLRLGSRVHREAGARQAEHHNREEAGHVLPRHAVCTLARPEVPEVVHVRRVKPEHGVQSVVQAERDEQTVEEAVERRAESAEAQDSLAESDQRVVQKRPDKVQNRAEKNGNAARHDGYAPLAAEERKGVRQLGVTEFVVAPGAN